MMARQVFPDPAGRAGSAVSPGVGRLGGRVDIGINKPRHILLRSRRIAALVISAMFMRSLCTLWRMNAISDQKHLEFGIKNYAHRKSSSYSGRHYFSTRP